MRATLAGLSLRDIEYALAVAQTLHFGRAAARCGVSQPALSAQVRKMEDLLGVRLFERGGQGVRVTRAGAPLLRQAERVVTEARALLDLAQQNAAPLSGELMLGAIATVGPYYLPHVLRHVRGAFARIDLRLTENLTAVLLDLLRRGELDAALIATSVPVEAFATVPLFFEPFRLVCPAEHRLAAGGPPSVADLDGEGLILLEDGHCLRDQALSVCRAAAGHMRHATSLETVWHMVAAGEGYSLLPALSLAGRSAMAGLVSCRALEDEGAQPRIGRVVALAWRATDPRADAFRELAGFLRTHLPDGVEAVAG